MMLNLMAVLNIFRFLAKAATNHHEEHWHEEDGQNRRGHHPAHYASTDGVLRAGAGTRADHQRHNAEDKRQGGHQDRTQTHTHCFKRCLN